MAAKVDLYNSSYGNYALGAYSEIRFETYGEDYGQTSWVTTAESHEIPKLLQLSSSSSVLEIGCGSGGYAVHHAKHIGCQVVGLDINAEGVRNAKALAEKDKLGARVKFEQCDVSQRLPSKIMHSMPFILMMYCAMSRGAAKYLVICGACLSLVGGFYLATP